MYKTLFFLLIFSVGLIAGDKVEIYASSMDSNGDFVEAAGGVSVVYKDYFLTADRAKYNRKSGVLELFENVRVNYASKYKVLGKYAKLNILKKTKLFEPIYLADKKSKVWLSADKGIGSEEELDISSGAVSGCNPVDPMWSIQFSSSNYDTESKWLDLYNARFYLYDIPVFYTPWFGYSLDTRRRTGLLMPSFGYSQSEGVYFSQPIYIAEQNWWDLELVPQIRTDRGAGAYGTFRFVDSKISKGEFKTGYFKEKSGYYRTNNIKNDKHYGYNFKYTNSDVINQWFGTNIDAQTGLYVDINHMNDVDYINLSSNDTENTITATQVLSRINMFYNTDKNYFGAYMKYYQDLTLENNDNTIQQVPMLQYHNYIDTMLEDHFIYSVDIKNTNYARYTNTNVLQTDFYLPLTLQTSILDEFINLAYTSNLYMQYSDFRGTGEQNNPTLEYRDGYYARDYHQFEASTQLTKGYENIKHVVGFDVSYIRMGGESKNGFYRDIEDPSYQDQLKFYNIATIQDVTQVDFNQYIYTNSSQEVLYHRLTQKFYNTNNSQKLGDLENELRYNITKYFSYYNNTFYNFDKNKLSKIFNSLIYTQEDLKFSLSHLFKNSFVQQTDEYIPHTSYLTSKLNYDYNRHYSFEASYNYDMERNIKKRLAFGFMYKKRCFNFGIKYSENNRPILAKDGTESSIFERYIYFTIILKPIMRESRGSLFNYKLPQKQYQ